MAISKNLVSLLLNAKTRTLVVAVGAVLAGGLLLVFFSSSKGPSKDNIPQSKTISVPTDVKSTPGANISQKHRELLEESNKAGAAKAAKTGGTFIPTITGNATYFQDNNLQAEVADGLNVNGKCTASAVAKLRKEGQDTLSIIKELKNSGCSADEIARLFNAADIAAALLAEDHCAVPGKMCDEDSVKKMKEQKIAINDITKKLLAAGCEPGEIAKSQKAAGFTLKEIAASMKANKIDANTVAKALMEAGYSKSEIIPALSAAGYTPLEIAKASATMDKIMTDKISAESGDSAKQLRADDAIRREAALKEAQQLAVYGQQRKDVIAQMVANMDSKAGDAITSWAKLPTQTFTTGVWSEKNSELPNDNSNGFNSKGGSEEDKVLLRAGAILFAVLETAVNSDEPGPILATIVSDSLKGSKLIGSMKANYASGAITMTFDTLSIPGSPSSMRISAVAIDPDTARTALATDVDNHYIYRWSALLASSFVTGYSSSLASAGTTSTQQPAPLGGTTTTTSAPSTVSPKTAMYAGISAVGNKFGTVAAGEFNKLPTITIDQGTSVGVLLTADLKEDFSNSESSPDETKVSPSKSPAAAQAMAAASAPASNQSLTPTQASILLSALTANATNANAATNKPADTTTTTPGG